MTTITSAENPRFRELLRLQQSGRERRKSGLALLEGVHLVEACHQHRGPPEQLIINEDRRGDAEIAALLAALAPIETVTFSAKLFARLSSVDTPTGILAVIKVPVRNTIPAQPGACVILEDIQDPGNLGSILRSTAAAGLREVYLSKHCADAWSQRVLRAGMGAHFLLDIHDGIDLGELIQRFPGRIIATQLHAQQSIYAADLTGTVGLVFGNEGAGLSRAVLDAARETVTIPMPGSTESLNIAAAVAVCLFERVRQGTIRRQ
ncbi:MAG: RNA methyltransferase [Gammaproteobacteria bacterium]|nr:RNA methyltransferase [Gammaproteobacteria bacterium]